ncbi:MAG: copper-containing nitrite reductase, partial [Acidimicrobiales bacterium]
DPGETQAVSLGVITADALAWCTVPGHREAGMELDIVATGASGPAADGGTDTAQQPAKDVTIEDISRPATQLPRSADFTRYEDGQAFDPVERTGPITIEARFKIVEGTAEMLPGTTMDFWTFDGAVPGPMIRGRVGDTLDFFLENPEDSELPHNVDFHAVTGPGGGAVTLDATPGATSNLTAKLVEPGVFIYHCAFPDVPTHLSHGMYGLIVVEPEGGLPEVDHEFYVMQSDFYSTAGGAQNISGLEDAGHLDFSGDNARLEEPTFVVWNGRPGSLTGDGALGADGSIQAGDSVRLFVGNGGPNLVSSFHVIGEILDRVYVEGSFGLVNTDVQTTLVPAGGAVAVEFTVDVPGDYLLVDHSLFRLHKGIGGILTAVGDERPDLYNPKTFSTDARGQSEHDE